VSLVLPIHSNKLVNNPASTRDIPPASVFQTQERSIFQSLNDGIRVFDLRIAYNPGNDTIGFHHCPYFIPLFDL